jgi:hypothetical protein
MNMPDTPKKSPGTISGDFFYAAINQIILFVQKGLTML